MSKSTLLILTEAGEGIGLGHYTRCSAIKKAALECGMACTLVVSWAGNATADPGDIVWNWRQEIGRLSEEYAASAVLLIDSYLLDTSGYALLRKHFFRLVVIDDYNRLTYPADLLINPNVYFSKMDYSSQTATCYGGGEFVILRDFFRTPAAPRPGKEEKVVVTIGGSDPHNVLPEICSALTGITSDKIHVICPEDDKRDHLSRHFPSIHFSGSLTGAAIADVFASVRIVISGCGQTLHELYAIGAQVIGIAVGADQYLNQEFYYEHGFLPAMISWQDEDLAGRIRSAFLQQTEKASNNTHIDRQLINREGVRNVIGKVLRLIDVKWRFAEMADCRIYFEWANDREVRSQAFNSDPIPWEAHEAWFRNKIKSDSLMLIFFQNEEPAGQLRIDWGGAGKGVIDFSVAASQRGKGLGSHFLEIAVMLVKKLKTEWSLQGIVKENNTGSAKAFVKAGFCYQGALQVNGYNCYSYSYANK